MTIVADLTPVYYHLAQISVQRSGSDVIAIADMQILGANGRHLAVDNPSTTLTQAEKQVLLGFVTRELAAYESATGLTKWVEP